MENLKEAYYNLVKEDASLLDFLMQNPACGLWFQQLKGQFTDSWISPSFWVTLGYDPHHAPHPQSIVHPDESGNFFRDFEYSTQNEPDLPRRYRLLHHNGVFGLYQIICKGITGQAGESFRLLLFSPAFSSSGSVGLKATNTLTNSELVNSPYLAVFEWNMQTGEFVFNDAWATMLGYRADELGAPTIDIWRRLAHPDDLEASDELISDLLEGRSGAYRMEARIKHKNGHYIWVLGQGYVKSWLNDGKPEWFLGFHQQITESKAVFEAVWESEQRYRSLFFQNPAPMWITDVETLNFIEVNEAAIQLYGYTYDEFLGMTTKDIRPEEEIPRLIETLTSLSDKPLTDEIWLHRKKNGELFNALVSIFKISHKNRPAFQVIVQDVSKEIATKKLLKEKAEQLRFVLEGSRLGLWDWHASSGKLEVDNRWKEMLGWDINGPDPTIDQWHELVHPDDFAILAHLMESVINHPSGRDFSAEIRARHRNGHYIWIYDSGSVMERDPSGNPLRISGTHLDITNRKTLEIQSQKDTELLEKIVNNIPFFVIHTDTYGRVIFRNQACGNQIAALEIDDKIFEKWSNILPIEQFKQHRTNATEDWEEMGLSTDDGRQIQTEWLTQRLDDGTYLSIGIDITERKSNLQSLRKANQLNLVIGRAQALFITDQNKTAAFEQILTDVLMITKCEYGFIGEVRYNGHGKPYLKTHAITDISWNDESKKFYDDNVAIGLEFHNLDTLFGAVITDGMPIVTNDPIHHPRSHGVPSGHPSLNSFAGIPFIHNGEVVGMLGLANMPGGFDNSLIDYLEPLTSTIGQLIYSMIQQRREAGLQQQLKDLSLIATHTDNLVIITDAQGLIEYVNESFTLNTGYEMHEVVGKKPGQILQGKHTDPAHILAMRRGIESKTTFTQEILNYTKEGCPYWVSCTIDPIFNEHGVVEKFIAIELDITESINANRSLTEAKEMLEQTNEIGKVGGWKVNFDTNKITWSRITKKIHDVADDYEPDLQTAIDFYREGSDRDTIIHVVGELIDKGKPYEVELRIVTAQGREKWVKTSGVAEFEGKKCKRIFGAFQDIDDYMRAKLALAKSIADYEVLVSMIPLGIYKINEKGQFIYVSPVWSKINGITSEDIQKNGMLAFERIHPDDREEFIARNFEALRQKAEFDIETRLILNGKVHWMHMQSYPHKEHDGSWYWFGTMMDITKRKEASLQLEENEKQLNFFFNQSLAGFFIMQLDEPIDWKNSKDKAADVERFLMNQKVVKINNAMLEHYGLSHDEAIGLPLSSFFALDMDFGRETIAKLLNDSAIQTESHELRKDGSTVIIDGYYICLYNEEGKITGHFGVQQDITVRRKMETELKSTQQLLQSIFEEMTDVMWSASLPDMKIKYVTPSIEKLRGNKPEKYVSGNGLQIFLESVHPDDRELAIKALERLKAEGYVEQEYRILDQYNKIKWVLNKARVVYDDQNQPIRLDGYLTDITQKKMHDNEMKKLFNLTKDQNDRLSNFTHIVSHNLKSHTANIEGLLYILLHKYPEIANDDVIHMFKGAAKNLDETIHHLNEVINITFTRENMVPINLNQTIKKSINSLAVLALESAVKLEHDIPEHINVLGLQAYLDSIVLNFLTNGIKYRSTERESYIRISAVEEGNFTILAISDNGLGIDLQKAGKKLFGMYKTFHRNKDARGIGLFITKNQVEALGGRIEVESQVNVGTTFKIYFKNG